jgi:heme exporter protein D
MGIYGFYVWIFFYHLVVVPDKSRAEGAVKSRKTEKK